MKKKHPLSVSFYKTGYGWILLRLNLPEKTIKIDLSSIFDPFEDLYKWLEDICTGDLPSEITIDEEGFGKRLVASILTKDAKDSFLLQIFNWETKDEKLIVKSELSKEEFVLTFVNRFESFLERKPDIQWSSYSLTDLKFAQLREYFEDIK